MKKETLFDAIDAMDSEIVEEALALEGKLRADIRRQRKRRITAVSAIAACLCLVIVIEPISNWIKGIGGPDKGIGLPIPTSPSFLLSLPGSTVYTDSNEPQQKRFEWHGRTLTLNYKNSHDVWYTDKHFSTYEMDGEENGSITFVKGTDKVHKISTTMNTLSRAVYTEEGLREKANEIVETYSTIDMDVMEYSCTSNMIETSEEESVDGFINSPSVESYTLEYVQKTEIGYTSCHATVEFGVDGSVDVEIFNEDTVVLSRYVSKLTKNDVYNAIEAAVDEYRKANPQIEGISCSVDERITIIKAKDGIYAVTKVKLFNDERSDEYFVRVFLAEVGGEYNSGTVHVNKQDSITSDEVFELLDEMIAIYNSSDTIQLENCNAVKEYLRKTLKSYEATLLITPETFPDYPIRELGITLKQASDIINSDLIFETNIKIKEERYSEVTAKEFFKEYEFIIAALLIDRLYTILPEDKFDFYLAGSVSPSVGSYKNSFQFVIKLDDEDETKKKLTIDVGWIYGDYYLPDRIIYHYGELHNPYGSPSVDPFADIRDKLKE
jgi:hypothetical protein